MHISLLQLLSIYFAIDHSYNEARLSGYYLVINQWEPTVLQGNNWSFIEGGKEKQQDTNICISIPNLPTLWFKTDDLNEPKMYVHIHIQTHTHNDQGKMLLMLPFAF